jgi:hypothetical protein
MLSDSTLAPAFGAEDALASTLVPPITLFHLFYSIALGRILEIQT